MVRQLLIAMLLLLLAGAAGADTAPGGTALGSECSDIKLCDTTAGVGQVDGGDGDCENAAGTNWVYDMKEYRNVTLFSDQSGATVFTCNLLGSSIGHDALTGTPTTFNSTALTATQRSVTVEGFSAQVWARCTAITGTPVIITGRFCKP